MSKASITKISKKLLALDLIHRTQLNDNRKEVYFRLTPQGKKLFELHRALHEAEEQRFMRFWTITRKRAADDVEVFQGMARYISER